MKVEKNNNSIFRNKHVLVVVAVMCIFTIIACMGFMLSVPAHAEENIAPKTEPIAFSTPIETVNELNKAFPITKTSEEAQEEITTAEVESSDAAEPEPRIETAEAAIEEAEPKPETIPDNLNDNEQNSCHSRYYYYLTLDAGFHEFFLFLFMPLSEHINDFPNQLIVISS